MGACMRVCVCVCVGACACVHVYVCLYASLVYHTQNDLR